MVGDVPCYCGVLATLIASNVVYVFFELSGAPVNLGVLVTGFLRLSFPLRHFLSFGLSLDLGVLFVVRTSSVSAMVQSG